MIDFRIGSIFGAGIGFELLTQSDFESINHEAEWALMLSLLFVRLTITKWPRD